MNKSKIKSLKWILVKLRTICILEKNYNFYKLKIKWKKEWDILFLKYHIRSPHESHNVEFKFTKLPTKKKKKKFTKLDFHLELEFQKVLHN